MELGSAISEQRSTGERRSFSWRTVAYGFTLSRRHAHRRVVDEEVIFLDWHHPWLFFLATGTMLLSCADAFLTLQLLELGMVEANPVMNAIMAQGTATWNPGRARHSSGREAPPVTSPLRIMKW